MPDLKDATQRKLSFFSTMKAVMWSFLGIRKKSGYEQDAEKLNPIYVIIAGILGAIIFVTTLLIIVKSVVANH